jgi:hypothetical protein
LLTRSLLLFKTNRLADFRVHVINDGHDVAHQSVDLMEAIYG